MSRDNQGRNLEAVKRHLDILAQMRRQGEEISSKNFEETVKRFPLADWETVEDVLVLRAGRSKFVAVPKNGKKTAANFEVIDLDKRELITLLKRDEVWSWLWRASQSE